MFKILVGALTIAMLIVCFTFVLVMFSLRLFLAIRAKRSLKQVLFIAFISFSLGYYYDQGDDLKIKLYDILIYIYFGLALLGIMFTIFQRLIPGYT